MLKKAIRVVPQGFIASGFEPVMRAFEDRFAKGIEKGSSVSFYYKGSLVVNIWGGLADEQIKRPWSEEIYGHFHSGTKFLSAVVIAQLVEKGLLNYEERVSKYWPEFAQNGKEKITLETLLSHKAGVSVSEEDFQMSWITEKPHVLSHFLASRPPLWEPGTTHGYSPFLIGLYLSEIVKRVDVKGRSLSQYFQEEMAVPFGLDFHIGLPKSLYHKASRFAWRKIAKEEILESLQQFQGNMQLFQFSGQHPSDLYLKYSLNDPDFASLTCGALHGIGTARGAAKFASIIANGGERSGKRLLGKKCIEKLQQPLSYGRDCVLSEPLTFGRGNHIFPVRQGNKSWFVIGHLGYGGQAILSDTHYNMGMAYCTNYMEPFASFENNRWKFLLETFYQCVGEIEGIHENVKLYQRYEEFLKDGKNSGVTSKL